MIKKENPQGYGPVGLNWVQGRDLNPRPSGYEPDELPGCSTLQQKFFREVMYHGWDCPGIKCFLEKFSKTSNCAELSLESVIDNAGKVFPNELPVIVEPSETKGNTEILPGFLHQGKFESKTDVPVAGYP
jgi:hypothetical protein